MKPPTETTPTKRWLPLVALGALALVAMVSLTGGVTGFAAGTWEVDRKDVANYLVDYWNGPKFASLGLTMLSFATDPAVEIELDGDGSYEIRWTIEPSAIAGKVISTRWKALEQGTWEILDQDMTSGRIQFTPTDWDLIEPADGNIRSQFLRQAQTSAGIREFDWRTINTNTLEWTPPGSTGSTITIRRM